MNKVNAKINITVTIEDNNSVVTIDVEKTENMDVAKMQALLKIFADTNKRVRKVMDTEMEAGNNCTAFAEEQASGIVARPVENEQQEEAETSL